MFRCTFICLVGLAVPVSAQIVSYVGTSFPENSGWTRDDRPFDPDRWLEDGWFYQYVEIVHPDPPVYGEDDSYRRSIAEFTGTERFFVEWVVETDGPVAFGAVAPVCFTVSGQMAIHYHFTIAKDQVLFRRDPYVPSVWVDVTPGVPHTYRLELDGDEFYACYIDRQVIDSGVPEGLYPTTDSVIVFGARASIEDSTTRWGYIRYGMIPEDGSGDYDSNALLDLADFYFFQECVSNSGPDNYAGPGCLFADFDADTDVDLRDIAVFQKMFTGTE